MKAAATIWSKSFQIHRLRILHRHKQDNHVEDLSDVPQAFEGVATASVINDFICVICGC
jgi:hypothetical protein